MFSNKGIVKEVSFDNILLAVNGGWSSYGQYSPCSKHCGGGNQTRHRLCDNPLPQNGGKSCVGQSSESRSCNTGVCPGNTLYTLESFSRHFSSLKIRIMLISEKNVPVIKRSVSGNQYL